MSPIPLKLLFKMYVHDRWEAEQRAHDALSEYRTHGEWFERDAALSYMDHLKEHGDGRIRRHRSSHPASQDG
jgi:hypothetical protein